MVSNCVKLITLLFLLSSCTGHKKQSDIAKSNNNNDYALYFQINSNSKGNKIISVNEKWSKKNGQSRYILVRDNEITTKRYNNSHSSESNNYAQETVIKTPVKRVICMSTSHLPFIKMLNQSASIVAISGGKYISDSLIRTKLENKEIEDIGYESSINYEILMQLKPDVVFTYGITGENNQYIEKIKQAGITVVVVSDYLENHPLGKLEYLKFFGAFFDKEEMADSLYNVIKKRYIDAQSRVKGLTSKPNVLLNAPWKDAWYIPGQNNYMSHLIADAGGVVLLSKPGESNSYTHSIENVIQKAYSANFWLNPNFFSTLKDLRDSNPLFSGLPVLKEGKVYNNNKRDTPGGGSDFWEKGVVEPDVILNDLINVLHPELDNKKELVYYKLLQ